MMAAMADVPLYSGPSKSAIGFLFAELDTGLTLARIALVATEPHKIERNRTNARKAYDSILRFGGNVLLSTTDEKKFHENLSRLKTALRALGESV